MKTHGVSPGSPVVFSSQLLAITAPCFRVQIACWVDEFFIFRPHAEVWAHIALIVLPWVEDWRILEITIYHNEQQWRHITSMAKPHLTDLSHFLVLRKSRSLMPFLSAKTALWIKSIFAYYGMQLAVWHFPTDSDLHFGCIQKWGISSIFHINIPCDTMSSWLIPQPSARICLELGQALTVCCTRNMREGTSELNGMDMKMSQNPAKLKDSYGSPPGSLGLLQWRGKA